MSHRRALQKSADNVSLNPERDALDAKEADAVLQDGLLKDQLETVWYCILHSGDTLRKQRCDAAHYRMFVEASGICSSDRHMNVALRNFGLQAEEDDRVSFTGFVKISLHLAADRTPIAGADRIVALRKLVVDFMNPYVDRHRAANAHDGSGPDDALLNIPEIDRLLYVYDTVFERIFLRYRDVDHHQTRELTMEQVKILDQFMEMEEMKEFLKDFGIFPKHISFVELSKACQWTCFGKILNDPTKQGAGRVSNIEAAKSTAGQVGANETVADPNAVNALFIPQLPSEYQSNEVLLDKPRFMSCALRLAQMMFSRPEHQKTLPSIVARAEEFLLQLAPTYEKIFNRTMDSDCDYTEKGVPLLNNVAVSAALSPDHGSMDGGYEITITGSNFCEKRGVFVRFGSNAQAVVRAKSIQKKKIVVDAPRMVPEDVEVDVDFAYGEYHVFVQKVLRVAVECSNNRWQFSETDPTQFFTFREQPRSWVFGVDLSSGLMKIFGAACALGGDRSNTKHMNREKWKEFKRIAGLSEALRGTTKQGQSADALSMSGSTSAPEALLSPHPCDRSGEDPADNDAFFLEAAEYHAGDHNLSLSFKAFLRVLTRTLYEMYGEENWRQHADEIGRMEMTTRRHVVQGRPVMEQNEAVLARRAIAMVERRSVLELDVFMGPVLCGVLSSLRGDVSSSFTGDRIVHVREHPFLSYDHRDINTEVCVLRHLQLSQSIAHFMKRLQSDGFDLAAHHPRSVTRKPTGRCWTVFDPDHRQMGALWDYEGNFSCLEWQPADREMFHPQMTMIIYDPEKSLNFILCYLAFSKSKDVQKFREVLESKGFSLKTKLFRVP